MLIKAVQDRVDALRAADPGNTTPVLVCLVTLSIGLCAGPALAQKSVAEVLGLSTAPEGQPETLLEQINLYGYTENSFVDNGANLRYLLDGIVTYTGIKNVTLALDSIYGFEENEAFIQSLETRQDTDARWWAWRHTPRTTGRRSSGPRVGSSTSTTRRARSRAPDRPGPRGEDRVLLLTSFVSETGDAEEEEEERGSRPATRAGRGARRDSA